MRRLLRVALLGGLLLERSRASVLYAFDGSDGVSLRDRDLADLVAMQSLGSDAESPRDAQFFSLEHEAEHNGITARIGGRGRARSDGITITRAIHRDTSDDSDADAGAGAVVFSPSQLNVGWVESCSPTMHTIHAKSRSTRTLRIEDVRFESDAFLLGSDPRGVELERGERVKIDFLFVVGEPQPFHSFIFLVTSLGEFALPVRGHTKPSIYGLTGLRVSVPQGARLEHTINIRNPSDGALRVSEIFSLDGVGNVLFPATHAQPTTRLPAMTDDDDPYPEVNVTTTWDVPPFSTQPVARFIFNADGATGRYHAAVRVATSKKQFLLPIRIDVWNDQVIVEPSDVDIGVFTYKHEQRHVLLTFHNMGSEPIAIRAVRAVDVDGLDVTADLQGDFPVIPSQSRVQHAVKLVLQDSEEYRPGRRSVQLTIVTNASTSDPIHSVHIRGFAMRGHLSYSLSQTMFRLVAPSASSNATEDPEDDGVVEKGATVSRELILKNEFDSVLELERVTFPPSCGDFYFEDAGVGLTPPSAAFPPIRLRVRPNADWPIATRVCPLQIETNASVHYVPIMLYSGLVRVTSSRNMSERTKPLHSCDNDTSVTEAEDAAIKVPVDQAPLPLRGAKLCRRVTVNLGKVATLATLDNVINVTNVNPVGVRTRVQVKNTRPKNLDEPLEVEALMSTHVDPHVPPELVMFGAAWDRSHHEHNALDTKSGSVLAPGRTLSLQLRFKITIERHEVFLKPAVTIETDFETIHVFVRFETTRGTIEPDVLSIEVPYIHPGRFGFIDFSYISTMEHDVAASGMELMMSDGRRFRNPFGVWQLPTVFRANTTTHVTLFYFSPTFYADCQHGRFYAECFIVDSTASGHELSGYGKLVTEYDLTRLRIRAQEWRRQSAMHDGDIGARVSVIATLSTDAVRSTPVHITAYMARPQFFHSGGSDQKVAFPLTEVLQQLAAYITITNPSDSAMDMELAIAEADRDLFYACDEDMSEDECVREWQDIATERVRGNESDRVAGPAAVAPLFFKPRTIHVQGHDQTQVGPIYFFPSSVATWHTQVFVRNDLTHIEALTLTASSGLGELSIALLQPQSINATHEGRHTTANAPLMNDISFLLDYVPDSSNKPADFRSTQTLQLTNAGSFQLMVSAHLTHVESNAFRMTSDHGSITSDMNGSQFLTDMMLAPTETLLLTVEFTADCFYRRFSSELNVVTREGVTRYHVVGAITPRAAFQCRRQLYSVGTLALATHLWVVAMSLAGITVLVALWQLVRGTIARRSARAKPKRERLREVVPAVKTDRDRAELETLPQSLCCLEDSLVTVASTAVVVPPHVAALLASRQSGEKGRSQSVGGVIESDAGGGHVAAPNTSISKKPTTLVDEATSKQDSIQDDRNTSPAVVESHFAIIGNQQPDEDQCELVVVEIPASLDHSIQDKSKGTLAPSPREDTASEESESPDNQVDAETDETFFSTPEDDDDENDDRELAGELLTLSTDDPYMALANFSLHEPRQEYIVEELHQRLAFEDEWSALSFDSLQDEIGKLVSDDRATLEAASPPASITNMLERQSIETPLDHPVGITLTSLSITPPPLPMSSLFASSTSVPPPLPRISTVIRAAPPGFTAADANPAAASWEARQRFHFHQPLVSHHTALTPASTPPSLLRGLSELDRGSAPAAETPFSARYSLFGPTLGGSSFAAAPPANLPPTAGHIGSRLTDRFVENGHRFGPRAERRRVTNATAIASLPATGQRVAFSGMDRRDEVVTTRAHVEAVAVERIPRNAM